MLPPSFMGLYAPQTSAWGAPGSAPQASQALNPAFGMQPGLYGATQGAQVLTAQHAGATPTQDPWAMMQPKLDAYMADWLAKQQAAARPGAGANFEGGGGTASGVGDLQALAGGYDG